MINIERDDIQIINRHSNLSANTVDNLLKVHIYNNSQSWIKFLRLCFISLGVGFAVAGIIFFFAYNWADLDKFLKLGMIEVLIVITTLIALFAKLDIVVKNIVLTAGGVFVGVLFAVFGQIYQTGANAYDFFLGWTLFITLWVIVSDFAPFWLIYLTLANTTLILYSQQVAHDWSAVFIFNLLFIINIVFLIIFIFISKKQSKIAVPKWFINIISLASVAYSTLGVSICFFNDYEHASLNLVLLCCGLYTAGILYGLRQKSIFYLSIIPFSTIIIISALLISISEGEFMFLLCSAFIISSVTLVIKNLINVQKKWNNE